MAGIEEQAFKRLTLELHKSVRLPASSVDKAIVSCFLLAGEFFSGIFDTFTNSEEMDALKPLLYPRIVFGLFDDETDWVNISTLRFIGLCLILCTYSYTLRALFSIISLVQQFQRPSCVSPSHRDRPAAVA